jgi:hypothetical protein
MELYQRYEHMEPEAVELLKPCMGLMVVIDGGAEA